MLFCLFPRISYAETARRNSLLTTNNPEAYAYFEVDENDVIVSGVYKNDRVTEVKCGSKDAITVMSFSSKADGSFKSAFSLRSGKGTSFLQLNFESGAFIAYTICCDENGWYFPENGLTVKNRHIFDHIFDAPEKAAELYLSASGEKDRIEAARERVKEISDSVTEGIEGSYEKARALSKYVSSVIYYDNDAYDAGISEETVAIENVMDLSRTVCIGFANFYCALLQAQGIDAVVVKGCAVADGITFDDLRKADQNHEFIAFWCEEQQRWVWADPCWSGSGDYKDGKYIAKKTHEKYFDVTDEVLSMYHRADYAERRSFFPADDSPEMTAEETQPAPEETTALPASETAPAETSPASEPQTVPETAAAPAETESDVPEETTAQETEASQETEAPAEETTAETTAAETAAETHTTTGAPDADKPAENADNISYIVLAAVLGAAVLALAIFIAVKIKSSATPNDR